MNAADLARLREHSMKYGPSLADLEQLFDIAADHARLTARCERLERVRVTAALYRKLGTFEFEKSREDLDAALAAIEQERRKP